jgi:hypothetical protein
VATLQRRSRMGHRRFLCGIHGVCPDPCHSNRPYRREACLFVWHCLHDRRARSVRFGC